MNRREAIRQTALLMGYAVSASAVAGVMAGCEVEQTDSWSPSYMSPLEARNLTELSERIVPRTTTPGAKDVGIHQFIDIMLGEYLKEKEVVAFKAGLADLEKRSQSAHQKSFDSISDEEKDAIITELANEAEAKMKAMGPLNRDSKMPKDFFIMAKELSLLGYFSSEKVGIEVLDFLPVPGAYSGCIPLSETKGVNWAI
ncbi:MAG: gluconate 2-dehydrogenase subunit 3 family protein [Bacteroidota bacterium]